MKKLSLLLFIFIFLTIGVTGCKKNSTDNHSGEVPESPEKITLGLQKLITPELIVRFENKYEEYLGENVEIVQFDSGSDVNTALASGSIDIGIMGTSVVATGLSNNMEIEVIWINDIIGSAESLIVKKNAGINDINDMKGKRIAAPFVSTAHFSLQNAIENSAISSSDMELLDMQPADILAAWERGDIDGAYVWYPVLGKLIDDGGVIITSSEEQAQSGAVTADVSVVRTEFAEQYPDIVKKYVKAQMYGLNKFQNELESSAEAIAGAADISVEEAREQINGFVYPSAEEQISERYLGGTAHAGQMSQVLRDAAIFLKEQGNIPMIPEDTVFENAINGKYIEMVLEESDS